MHLKICKKNTNNTRKFQQFGNNDDVVAQIEFLQTDQDFRENPQRKDDRRRKSAQKQCLPAEIDVFLRGIRRQVKEFPDIIHPHKSQRQDQ